MDAKPTGSAQGQAGRVGDAICQRLRQRGRDRGDVIVWDHKDWLELFRFGTSQRGILDFQVDQDEKIIACGVDGSIRIWETLSAGENVEGVWRVRPGEAKCTQDRPLGPDSAWPQFPVF